MSMNSENLGRLPQDLVDDEEVVVLFVVGGSAEGVERSARSARTPHRRDGTPRYEILVG